MRYEALAIGGSAGSLEALIKFLPELHSAVNYPIFLVVHRKPGPDALLVDLLRNKTKLNVKEADEKEAIKKGTIYIAPADYHLLIEQNHTLSLDYSEKVHYCRPAIDVTFQSAADVYGKHLMCLLLSGANADGANGMATAAFAGALTMVQHPDTAQTRFMPEQAILTTNVSSILKIDDIAAYINSLFSLN